MMALIFVALVQDAQFAAAATDAVPIGMLIDTLFLLIFILLLKSGLIKAVLLSLSFWFVMAFLAQKAHLSNIVINIVLYFITAVIAYLFLEFGVKIPAKGSSRKKYSPGSLFIRILKDFFGLSPSILLSTPSTTAGTYSAVINITRKITRIIKARVRGIKNFPVLCKNASTLLKNG
jgi:hypothetical protein